MINIRALKKLRKEAIIRVKCYRRLREIIAISFHVSSDQKLDRWISRKSTIKSYLLIIFFNLTEEDLK